MNKHLIVEPIINYPRQAQVGKAYLMTIDLKVPEGAQWEYEEEEYPVYFMLETLPLFSHKPMGESAVVLHRFGGSYGAAMFLLTATLEEMEGVVKVNLVNRWGLPIKQYKLNSGVVTFQTEDILKTDKQYLKTDEPNLQENTNKQHGEMDDEFAIEEMRRGKQEGLVVIYERYADKILRLLIYKYKLSHEEAEEITQDTFLQFYRLIDQFQEKVSVQTWLFRIALNEAQRYWRKSKYNSKSILESNDMETFYPKKVPSSNLYYEELELTEKELLEIPDTSPSMEKKLCYECCIARALKMCAENFQNSEYLKVLTFKTEGYSIKEIAEKLNVTHTFVYKTLYKLKPYFQYCIDECKDL